MPLRFNGLKCASLYPKLWYYAFLTAPEVEHLGQNPVMSLSLVLGLQVKCRIDAQKVHILGENPHNWHPPICLTHLNILVQLKLVEKLPCGWENV